MLIDPRPLGDFEVGGGARARRHDARLEHPDLDARSSSRSWNSVSSKVAAARLQRLDEGAAPAGRAHGARSSSMPIARRTVMGLTS